MYLDLDMGIKIFTLDYADNFVGANETDIIWIENFTKGRKESWFKS